MNTVTAMTVATLCASCVIVYSSFCRLTIMSKRTARPAARYAFWALASVALFSVFEMLFYGWRPDSMHAAAFIAIAWVQVLGRRNWKSGVPEAYRNSEPTI